MYSIVILGLLTVCAAADSSSARDVPNAGIVFENECAKWEIASDGATVHFIDKATGQDYAARDAASGGPCVRVKGQIHRATKAVLSDGHLILAFGDSGARAVLTVTTAKRSFLIEVLSCEGAAVEELTFLDILLTLRGKPDEPFAGCVLALNLKTNVQELPGPSSRLRATSYSRFGFQGVKAAIVACPQGQLRAALKDVIEAAPELPHSALGGPWALDAKANRGSYLIDSAGEISEETVDDWIRLAASLGIQQIDFHTGHSFRFGDYAPSPAAYPRGIEGVKAVIDKLHAAGILAGLHTYAFYIAKDTPWVTPKPDPRLAKDATFTLTEPITAEAASIPVIEPTKDMSTVTGFQIRNSVTLQIDDELITYADIAKEPPYAFAKCQRGAHGTKAVPHDKGARVSHLKECFGLFTPDGDSSMFTEVAAKTAEVYNDCGFDMIYLDALDGSDILAGGQWAWYYGSKFVFELAKRLKKPAIMEMSTFHHHLWSVRSRMGAWDVPARGAKRFIDIHNIVNRDCARMFLPSQLGWWGVFNWDAVQPERTFSDDVEYLCGKALAYDSGLSLLVGFTPKTFAKSQNTQRLGAMIKQYEELRLSNRVSEACKAKLRAPGAEFTLQYLGGGKWGFRPVVHSKHTMSGNDPSACTWLTTNSFAQQPLRLRLEALMAADSYDAESNAIVADFSKADEFAERAAQPGVTASLESVSSPVKVGTVSARFAASSTCEQPDAAWAMFSKKFSPTLNLAGKGLGLWVHGDGLGETLNFQLRSPQHLGGGISDHYVIVDFTGWRYVSLIEPESDRIVQYAWPYTRKQSDWEKNPELLMASAYPVFHIWVDYGQIESLSIWYNNLPAGKQVECFLSPIKAVPLAKAQVKNPAISIGGKTLTFPIALESGSYIEYRSASDCKVYDGQGESKGDIVPQGDAVVLETGENELQFSTETISGTPLPRARVTVISQGEPLEE